MIQSTTVTHKFTLPFSTDMVKKINVSYRQRDVQLDISDVSMNGNVIAVQLNQENTLNFDEGLVKVQLNIITVDGNRLASRVFTIKCEQNLFNEVML